MTETCLAPDGKRYALELERTPEGLQLMLGGVRPQNNPFGGFGHCDFPRSGSTIESFVADCSHRAAVVPTNR